jgi:hypothetical protein
LASQAWYLKLECSIGAEHQYTVGNEQRLCDVMGHEQRRRPCHQLGELVVEAGARDGIKRRERFVEQQERRSPNERASKCYTTTLSPRDLTRTAIKQPTSANAHECRLGCRACTRERLTRQLQGEGHIAKHRAPWKKPCLLKDDADLSSTGGRRATNERDLPGRWREEPGD